MLVDMEAKQQPRKWSSQHLIFQASNLTQSRLPQPSEQAHLNVEARSKLGQNLDHCFNPKGNMQPKMKE